MKTTQVSNQHTPGPWTATETGIFGQHITGHGNFYIAVLPFPSEPTNAQDAANLKLIAAAPELLAELEKSLIRLEHYCCLLQTDTIERRSEGLPQSVEVEFCCQQIQKNRAAIARATGK